MSISIFNIQNHRLDGEMLRKLNDFSTGDFGGMFATLAEGAVPFSGTGSVTINSSLPDPIVLMGGGCIITVPKSDITSLTLKSSKKYVVIVNLSNLDNFISDETVSTSSVQTEIRDISALPETYTGRTIWVNSTVFEIPLFETNGSKKVTSLIEVKDGKSWREFLTADALAQWEQAADAKYTWKAGSAGNTQNGKVGNYDFSADALSHIVGTTSTEVLATTSDNVFKFSQYGAGALSVDSNHIVNSGTLSVENGGTGGTDKSSAKQGLGIFYGSEHPSEHTFDVAYGVGDIYFRILEG